MKHRAILYFYPNQVYSVKGKYLQERIMDKELFSWACGKIINNKASDLSKGIGTLGEKTLHSVLKNYFEPDENRHEVRLSGYVADILTDNGIIEIQTRQFNALRKKLDCFLGQTRVTIVYPIARTKWLIWIDETTGEITKKRKSPKTGKPYAIFYELYKIKNMLCNKNLRLCIVLVDLEEYRHLNGWSTDKKKGSSRYDRIPVDIVDQIYINSPDDYTKLIPEELKSAFTSKDFMKASGLTLATAQTALNVLNSVGAVVRSGKVGNTYVYARNDLP